MRKIVLLIIMFLLMVFTVYSQETIRKEFNVQKGQTLDLDMKGSVDVNITGWKNERLTATIHFKKSSPGGRPMNH